MLSGPVVGGLVNKFGCRPVCMAGAVLAWASLSLSTLSNSVPLLMLTYGLLGGFGMGLIYLPAIVSVGFYFESKRALATGISVCGSGVGTFVFAPFSNYLLTQYDWQTSNLIFAAICLSCVIFGAMMRPLQVELVKLEDESKEITLTLPDGSTLPSTAPSFKAMPPIRSVLTMPKIAEEDWETLHEKEEEIYEEDGEREPLKMTCNRNDSVEEDRRVRPRRRNESETFPLHQLGSRTFGLQSNLSTPHLRPSWSWSRRESQVSQIQGLDLKMSASSARLPRPMSRKDVFYTGSIINMVEEEPGETLRNNVASYVSLGKGSNILMPRDSLVFGYK